MENGKKRSVVKYKGETKKRNNYALSTEFENGYDAYPVREPGLEDYADILKRRKWILITCFLVSVVTVTAGSLLIRLINPVYKSEAVIEIAPENPKITTFQEVVEFEAKEGDDFYKTQYEIVKSRTLAKVVVNALKLDSHPEFAPEDTEGGFGSFIGNAFKSVSYFDKGYGLGDAEEKRLARDEDLIESFLEQVKISPVTDSRLVKVSFESSDPELSARAVNTLADKYIEWVLERKVSATKAAREFLGRQLAQVKAKLENAEKLLSEFAKNSDIVSLDKDLNLTYTQLAELNDALSKAKTEELSKEALYREVQAGNYEYLGQVLNDPSIQAMNEEYTKLQAQYNNLGVLYDFNYPDMKQLGAQIARIKGDIQKRINTIAEGITKDYKASVTKESVLREATREWERRTTELNDKASEYKILEREVDTNKSIYQDILQRLKETEVTSGIKTTNVQVVDYAAIPTRPFKPNIPLNMLLAALAGVMAGVFLTFVFEYFDNTIKDEEEVKKRYNLPFLGAIPLTADGGGHNGIEKAVYADPRSLVSEAFRMIRTSIMYSSPSRPPRLLLVTSTQPSEGKTTSASNIALSMIQSGRKAVLIDADLRKPRLHDIYSSHLSSGNERGLSTYLLGQDRLPSVLKHTDIDGLDIITSGPTPPNPAELLSSEKMKQLLRYLRKKYDYVIVDAAPILSFADARLISRLVDGVIVVAGVRITQRQHLDAGIEEILNVKGKIVGTIVNRLESRRGKYGYNYYYYHSDGKNAKQQIRGPKTKEEPGPAQSALLNMAGAGKNRWSAWISRNLAHSILLTIGTLIFVFYFAKSDLLFDSGKGKNSLEAAAGSVPEIAEGEKKAADESLPKLGGNAVGVSDDERTKESLKQPKKNDFGRQEKPRADKESSIGGKLDAPKKDAIAPPHSEYLIKTGDNLWDIAKSFNVSVNDIKIANEMRGSKLKVGDTLIIPAAKGNVSQNNHGQLSDKSGKSAAKNSDTSKAARQKYKKTTKRKGNHTDKQLTVAEIYRIMKEVQIETDKGRR